MVRTGSVGECVFMHEGDKVTIIRADPQILISTELLLDIAAGGSRIATLDGDLLKIDAANRTVIYRIGDLTHDGYCYHAEWPD